MICHAWRPIHDHYYHTIGISVALRKQKYEESKREKKESWNTRILWGISLYRRKTNDIQQRKPISQISSYTDDIQAPQLSGSLFVPSNTLCTFKGPSRELSMTWHQLTIPELETKVNKLFTEPGKAWKRLKYTQIKVTSYNPVPTAYNKLLYHNQKNIPQNIQSPPRIPSLFRTILVLIVLNLKNSQLPS